MNKPRNDKEQWAALFQHRWGRALLAVVALLILVVAGLGGFRKAGARTSSGLPVLTAGQRGETGAFALTALRAWVADATPGNLPNGKRYLVLRVRAENLTASAFAATAFLQQDVVWLPTGQGGERKGDPMRRADDHTLGVILQPKQPTVVDMAWDIPANITVPTQATWGAYARVYRERGYLQGDGDAGWKQVDPTFKLTLAIGAPPPGALRE